MGVVSRRAGGEVEEFKEGVVGVIECCREERISSNYINNEKRGRVSPRTKYKLFLSVVQVVSNLNIPTF